MPEAAPAMVAVTMGVTVGMADTVSDGMTDDARSRVRMAAMGIGGTGHGQKAGCCRYQNQETHIASSETVDL